MPHDRLSILAVIDWHSLIVMGGGAVIVIGSIIKNAIKELKKSQEAEQRRMSRPLDSGETGRAQARTDATNAATAQRVERARVLNEPPPTGPGQTQRGRIEAALKTRLAAQMKRSAEIEQAARAQRAARLNPQSRQQQPRQQPSRPAAPIRPPSQQPAPRPAPVSPQQVAQRRQPPGASGTPRLVKQAAVPLFPSGATPAQPMKAVAGRTLRQAFIWHEILDRPVALREPIEPV